MVSTRQTLLRGGGALLLGVVAFFYGKQIYYDILYPGPGFPYRVQPIELVFWGALGLLGGVVLGAIGIKPTNPGDGVAVTLTFPNGHKSHFDLKPR